MKKNILVGFTVLAVFVFGVIVGARSGSRSEGLEALGTESAQTNPPEQPGSVPRQNTPAFVATTPNSVPENGVANSDSGPSSEELAAREELARRRAAGEYLLDRDNPSVVRMWERHLKQKLEMMVPPIAAARQDVLSSLGVEADTIAKFTNHAARIIEASTLVGQALTDLKKAKVEYDRKARKLLTPEQYAQFHEFEIRQAVEKELEQFQVSGAEGLANSDLVGISKSIADLGMREEYQTNLPYEQDPSVYFQAGETLKDFKLDKLAELEVALQDLPVIAERNQLSEEARQLMAVMIERRSQQLRSELEQLPILEQRHREWLRSAIPRDLPPP